MIRFATIAMALLFLLGACSPKAPIQNDPWLNNPEESADYEVQADTLTYDFLAESQADDEAEPEPEPEPDLPVLDETPVA